MGILNKISKKSEEGAAAKPTRASKTAKTPKAVDAAPAEKSAAVNTAGTVLAYPYLSEKVAMQESQGIYTFVVTGTATKVQVKQAVQSIYGVMPTQVRMMQYEGKNVRFGRTLGRRGDWKKAVVTLPKGKTISVHTGV